MMSLTFGLFTQVHASRPLDPLVSCPRHKRDAMGKECFGSVYMCILPGRIVQSVARLTQKPEVRVQ